MKNKTSKKIKLITKGLVKKTGVFIKKADKQSSKIVKAIKKEWKKEQPQREMYKNELKSAAKKAGEKGLEMFNEGLKNSIKIGGDVAETIKKDINEIRDRNKNK